MADTGIKKNFGPAHVSFEPLSGYVILTVAGQTMPLERKEFGAARQAFAWVIEEEKRRYEG